MSRLDVSTPLYPGLRERRRSTPVLTDTNRTAYTHALAAVDRARITRAAPSTRPAPPQSAPPTAPWPPRPPGSSA